MKSFNTALHEYLGSIADRDKPIFGEVEAQPGVTDSFVEDYEIKDEPSHVRKKRATERFKSLVSKRNPLLDMVKKDNFKGGELRVPLLTTEKKLDL